MQAFRDVDHVVKNDASGHTCTLDMKVAATRKESASADAAHSRDEVLQKCTKMGHLSKGREDHTKMSIADTNRSNQALAGVFLKEFEGRGKVAAAIGPSVAASATRRTRHGSVLRERLHHAEFSMHMERV